MMLTKKEPETFTYEEAAAYIEEIPKFTKKHTLEHTKLFLKRFMLKLNHGDIKK